MQPGRSRITSKGRTLVPPEVRTHLGLAPGSVIEWHAEGVSITVRRVGRVTSEDIHRVLFPEGPPPPRTLDELREGIRTHVARRHRG